MPNNESAGFRYPTEYEIQQISACIELSNSKSIRRNKRLYIFFMVMGVSMITTSGTQDSPLVIVAIGFVFLALAMLCICNKKTMTMETDAVKKGSFCVRDGYISKLGANRTTTGCLNAVFISVDGTFKDGEYRVRCEQVAEGTCAILVHVYFNPQKPPHRYLFTPFMLTDEGIRLHW